MRVMIFAACALALGCSQKPESPKPSPKKAGATDPKPKAAETPKAKPEPVQLGVLLPAKPALPGAVAALKPGMRAEEVAKAAPLLKGEESLPVGDGSIRVVYHSRAKTLRFIEVEAPKTALPLPAAWGEGKEVTVGTLTNRFWFVGDWQVQLASGGEIVRLAYWPYTKASALIGANKDRFGFEKAEARILGSRIEDVLRNYQHLRPRVKAERVDLLLHRTEFQQRATKVRVDFEKGIATSVELRLSHVGVKELILGFLLSADQAFGPITKKEGRRDFHGDHVVVEHLAAVNEVRIRMTAPKK